MYLKSKVQNLKNGISKVQDLRKAGPGQHLSMGTALGAGIQALEALEDLHSIGYLHRSNNKSFSFPAFSSYRNLDMIPSDGF